MPCLSSESSSEYSSSRTAQTRNKRRIEAESSSSSDDDHDTSDASNANGEDSESDAPQPLPSVETTVLSHADRRRQKKREKQLASESPRKKRKLDAGTAANVDAKTKTKATATKARANPAADDPRRPKRQNSIWVGNLSFRTTQDALRGFFDGVGMVTRIHMPMRRRNEGQGENIGFAFVDFDTPEAKVIAITLSEGQLDGRNLLIKDGDDFTGRPAKAKTEETPMGTNGGDGEKVVKTAEENSLSKTAQKILRAQKQPPAPTLFLGNLGFETTEASIRGLFEMHRYGGHRGKGKAAEMEQNHSEGQGKDAARSKDVWIRKIRMGTFEDTGACKGFAFVDFTSIEHATEALINPRNHRLDGRDLVVEYASPDAVRRGGGGSRRPKEDRDQKSKSGGGRASQKGSANAPYSKQRRPWHTEQHGDAETAETPAESTTAPRSRQPERADRPHTGRARPGAALAQAQRQSAAIVASQGQKIVF